ncbi:MAG: hypothetical protein ACPGVT_03300 [Maricaulaceae bacterium]
MIRFALIAALCLPLYACGSVGGGQPRAQQFPENFGNYVRPDYMQPQPTLFIPAVDACNSRIYAGLIGQHEGAIYIAGLPGPKRILKPAYDETNFPRADGIDQGPSFMEVREYLADQTLYAPSVSTVTDAINLGPDDPTRLTVELDVEGYVQAVNCR